MSEASKSALPNVAKASAIMVASLLLSRVLGIVREIIISWKFGQDSYTDAYRLAFVIPDILFFLIAGGALSSAFIPVFSEYFHTDRKKDAWQIFGSVATIMSVIVLVFVAFAWIFAVPLAHWVCGDKPIEQIELVAQMSRIMVPAQFAFLVGGLMIGTLYARQVFTVPGLSPNIYNLGIIAGALVISSLVAVPITGLAWGALFGALLGSLVFPIFMMRRLGSEFRPSLDLKHEGVRKVFRLMGPVIFGLSLPGVFPTMMRMFGARFGTNYVSAMENANQLMQAPLGVFGQSLALAAFPALSQFFAQGEMNLFRDQLTRSLKTVLYLSIPVSILFIVSPMPIVQLLFQHGKFTAEDSHRTAQALGVFAVGICAWCMQPLLMRAFFSVQKAVLPVILGTITSAVFISLCYAALSSGQSYLALPAANSISAFLLVGMLLVAVQRSIGALEVKGILSTMGKAVGASLLASVVLWLGSQFIADRTLAFPVLLAVVGLGVLAYGWAYYFLTRWLKMPESDLISRAIGKVSRKSPAKGA